MAKKDRKWILSPKSTGNFRIITAGIQIIKICVFSLVRVCRQTCRSFSCNVDLIGWNSNFFFRFIHSDHFFEGKHPRFFRLNVSIYRFVFVKNLSNDELGLNFMHRKPFAPKSPKSAEKFHFSQKLKNFFFKTNCGINLLFKFFSLSKHT